MSEKEMNSYRLTSLEEPTDEMLTTLMKEVAEEAKRKETIEQFVDNAIAEGKINSDAKTKWVEMAQNDFEMVQATLNSIPKRDKISAKIANDPANIENAENQMTEAEKKMAKAVEAVVGTDFQFKTLD